MHQLWERLLHRRAPEEDPLVTLELQASLSRLLAECWRIHHHSGFAGAHHARAAVQAYEITLRSALRHAGGDDAEHAPGDIVALELDLASRGWIW